MVEELIDYEFKPSLPSTQLPSDAFPESPYNLDWDYSKPVDKEKVIERAIPSARKMHYTREGIRKNTR